MGLGMVHGYVMKGYGVRRVMPHGERSHVNVLQQLYQLFQAELKAALFVLCNIQLVFHAVALSQETQMKGQPLKRPDRATVGGQRGCCAPVFGVGVGPVGVGTKCKCSTCQVSVIY
jgi:hypothetical protein